MTDTPVIPSYITATTVDLANFVYAAIENYPANYTVAFQDVIGILSNYVESKQSITLQLSDIRPDFESIKQQFQAELQGRDAWKDIIQAGGGATVLDFISSVGTYGQSGIFNALQEANLDTAVLTSSIYTIMRMLGVHIRRKIPASVMTELVNTSNQPIVIPTMTQFSIGDQDFFNRDPIVFDSTITPVTAKLYQGTVQVDSIISTGYPYQRFELGNNAYDVSDTDIYAYQDSALIWSRVEDGLYKYGPTNQVFYENSTPEGNVEILFGNNIYGKIPKVNSLIIFVYVNTNGDAANSTSINSNVVITGFSQYVPDRVQLSTSASTQSYLNLIQQAVSGVTTSIIDGGAPAKDKNFYQAVGPFLNSAKKGMIRKLDHFAVALEYPGVADILFQNQKDIAPYNRNLINVVYVTPLMTNGQLMTAIQWEDFKAFLDTRQIWRVDWVLFQPKMISVSVEAILYCTPKSDLTNLGAFAEYNIRKQLAIGRGRLGSSLLRSDINSILKLNYQNMAVDYVDLLNPLSDIYINKTEWIYLDPDNLKLKVKYSTRNYQNSLNNNQPEEYTVL